MADEIFIHPSSIVDKGSVVGKDTRIWHFCHVMSGATIGSACVLGQNVFVGGDVQIGNGVKIQNNVSVYTGVTIEDDVFLGPSCVLTNVINPRSEINRKSEFRKTLIKKGATIGANATIICGVTVGQYAFIAAGSVVTRDVPAFALVKGNPSRISGWVGKSGAKLNIDKSGFGVDVDGTVYQLINDRVDIVTSSY